MQRMLLLFGVFCLLLQCSLSQTIRDDADSASKSFTAFLAVESTSRALSTGESEPEKEVRPPTAAASHRTTTTPSSADVHVTNKPLSQIPGHSPNASLARTHPLAIPTTSFMPHPFPRPPSPTSPSSPIHQHPPDPTPTGDPSGKHGQPVVAIVFEVIGAVVGAFILFMVSRCLYSWKLTPHRNNIESLLDRHYLESEMQERERQDLERRIWRQSSVLRPPPPPYQPAPAYDTVASDMPGA